MAQVVPREIFYLGFPDCIEKPARLEVREHLPGSDALGVKHSQRCQRPSVQTNEAALSILRDLKPDRTRVQVDVAPLSRELLPLPHPGHKSNFELWQVMRIRFLNHRPQCRFLRIGEVA